jgi:hypothetical protein
MKIIIVIHPPLGEKYLKHLEVGTIHEVIERPKNNPAPERGIWIMGIDEPVKLLFHEFEWVKEMTPMEKDVSDWLQTLGKH